MYNSVTLFIDILRQYTSNWDKMAQHQGRKRKGDSAHDHLAKDDVPTLSIKLPEKSDLPKTLIWSYPTNFNLITSAIDWAYTELIQDSEDDYCTGCRNISHYQQQSYSGLLFTMKRLLGSNLLQCFICCRHFQMHILLTVSSVMCALQLWVSSTHISSFMHRWLSS